MRRLVIVRYSSYVVKVMDWNLALTSVYTSAGLTQGGSKTAKISQAFSDEAMSIGKWLENQFRRTLLTKEVASEAAEG